MITFDRLRLYYFHRHNLTYYSDLLLSNIQTLALDQGSLTQDVINDCEASVCTSVTAAYDRLLESVDYKKNYTDSFISARNPNGLGFFVNNLEFFYFELPSILLTYFALSLVFRLLFNFRVSVYFRKYAFYGTFLLILYEGNVEQLSFFFFSECRNLFSSNLSHKFANVIMIYFFFFVVVFSVAGLLFFFYHYRKLVKYFIEDSEKVSIEAVVLESLERSVYPLVFGSVHALFLDSLGLQTIILAVVETAYFLTKLFALRSKTPKSKLKVGLLLMTSLLRLGFIVSFYINHRTGESEELINLVHYEMVWIYILCWISELLKDIGELLLNIFAKIKKSLCMKHK
jgi:hypothetical protein